MAKELGVLVIHGMGTQSADFAQAMIDELDRRVSGSDRIAWQSVFWADVLSARQAQYLDDANRSNSLDFFALRRFVVSALGDAAAYRRVNNSPTSTYGQIHTKVRDGVQALHAALAQQDKPLVVLAHSLGGHILSNYIWDVQQSNPIVPPGANPFEQMQTLRRLVTFGCNIPLFTFAFDPVVAIALPAGAQWHNYYDKDDVLGYPLRPISTSYENTVSADIQINVGGILSSWNPMAHGRYWTDNDFTVPVAAMVQAQLP